MIYRDTLRTRPGKQNVTRIRKRERGRKKILGGSREQRSSMDQKYDQEHVTRFVYSSYLIAVSRGIACFEDGRLPSGVNVK